MDARALRIPARRRITRSPSARGRRLVVASVLALSVMAPAACSNPDAVCTPDSNPDDTSDGCPYGPPGGPKVQEASCPDIEQDAKGCTTTWDDVYALFDAPPASCTLAGCHGDPSSASFGIYLPSGDAATAYASLSGYKGSSGYPYINAQDPKHSWVLCNLQGVPGGGFPMPKPSGLVDPSALAVVEAWARCGMPGPGQSGTGGGGGAGGAGGGAGGSQGGTGGAGGAAGAGGG